MPHTRLGRALENRVARRMTVVFFLCTVVPLGGFAWLTIRQTTNTLEDRAQRMLQAEARGVGQEALGRLELLSRSLTALAATLARSTSADDARDHATAMLQPAPRSLSLVPAPGAAPVHIIGSHTPPALSPEQDRQLQQWGHVMVGPPETALLVVGSTWRADPSRIFAAIDVGALFRLDDEDGLPPDSAACVASDDAVIACSPAADPAAAAAVIRSARPGQTMPSASGPILARTWSAPLTAQYGGPTWTVVLMRPQAVVLAPVRSFTRNFLLMAIVVTLLVTWVSLGQVRRSLKPLDQLMAATRRMAHRDFGEPLRVTSRDEFEIVAGAFNDMAATLEQQFADLEAFSLGSLAALARAIDAKSPWTSGHSERVTAIAMTLGRQVRLSEVDLHHLQRGGLVHDLGKLATPPAILDKPGRLTAEEYAIMQRHPEQGVRILEPIPAFTPLLPIVAQHHEWWNGGGYPRGLAGEAISRLARILAVADVYDALRSARPYRPGLSHARVVDVIVSGAGEHFDPEVVDAFLSIAGTIDTMVGYHEEPGPVLEGLPMVEAELVQVGRD